MLGGNLGAGPKPALTGSKEFASSVTAADIIVAAGATESNSAGWSRSASSVLMRSAEESNCSRRFCQASETAVITCPNEGMFPRGRSGK